MRSLVTNINCHAFLLLLYGNLHEGSLECHGLGDILIICQVLTFIKCVTSNFFLFHDFEIVLAFKDPKFPGREMVKTLK